ncbi:cupin domain-containing protein [Cloacibacillus evryensis]|nr:cupin domain-containing protein [Cloacibacillus evryensis]
MKFKEEVITMLIDFEKIAASVIHNFYGGEKETEARMFFDGTNRIAYSTLAPGASVGMHLHDNGSEIVYVLKGRGMALYDGGTEELSPWLCHYCPKGHSHSIVNDGSEELIFLSVVPRQ